MTPPHSRCKISNKPGNTTGHQAQHDGGGERKKKLAAKQLKAQVTRQSSKAQLLEKWRKPVDEHQGQKNNDKPAKHGSECMRAVTRRETYGLPKLHLTDRPPGGFDKTNDLEQFTHFMLHDQFLRINPFGR